MQSPDDRDPSRPNPIQYARPGKTSPHLPRTVEEALKELISKLPLKDKTMIARMTEDELTYLHTTLGQYTRNRFGLWTENRSLMQSCRLQSGENLNEDECSALIVKELWKELRATHGLRVLK